MKARWLLIGSLIGVLFAAGCATEVGTIDRTQSDKLEKKLFAGIWFMTQEVIDIGYNGAFSFVGEMNFGANAKVIFDIQKDMLIVYPVTEYIQDSEKEYQRHQIFRYWDDRCMTSESERYECIDGVDNLRDPERLCCFVDVYVGQPLAAFSIKNHFEVQREYNSGTGYQGNVLEENDYDKEWWQRKWFRVDWTRNNINDFTFLARMIKQSPVDYYVQEYETDNPDAPTFSEDYIDLVTKVFGEPESTGSCDIYAVSPGDCTSAVMKIRTAFRKVDVDQNYEPQRYANEEEATLFGYFLTSRYAWDEDYGLTEAGKVQYINRWNLWRNSFDEEEVQILVTGEDGTSYETAKPCFKDMEDTGCDTTLVDGSKEFCRADGWFQHGTCVVRTTRPYVERGLKPIVYSVSESLPEDFWPATRSMANEWSDAFKDTVAWLYFWEEKGMIRGSERVRACETNADCATHAVADIMFDADKVDDKSMLPTGTSGRPLYSQIAMTAIVGPDGAITIPDWGYPKSPSTVMSGKCAIRFVNLDKANAATLSVNGTPMYSDVSAMTKNSYDPATPAHTLVSAGELTLQVTAGSGNAEANLSCVSNHIALAVYTGSDLIVSDVSKNVVRGLRVVNATNIALDISLNGAIRGYNVVPGESTGYSSIPGGIAQKANPDDQILEEGYVEQRLVATEAGARGDVTCLKYEGRSVCAGYNSPLTVQDFERVAEIKAKLPEMFVLCHNSYLPADDQGNLNDDEYKSNLYAPWIQIKNATDEELAELPVMNPCVDFLYNADKLTEDQKLAQATAMKKPGDSRYSMVYWISETQYSSPLGYGPSAADPDTGEIFWGVANIYGAFIYYYQNLYRDLFELLRGTINTTDYVTGESIRDIIFGKDRWVEDEQGGSVNRKASVVSLADSAREMNAHLKALDMGRQISDDVRVQDQKGISFDEMISTIRKLQKDENLMQGLPTQPVSFGRNRLSLLKGTKYEELLNNEEVRYATESLGESSPLDWMNLETINKKEIERHRILGENNYCFYDFEDEGLIGMVKAWACMPNDTRPICDTTTFDPMLRDNFSSSTCCIDDPVYLGKVIGYRMYEGTVIHEVGHTVGLRHNFSASTDVFNFFDPYYDIREKEPLPCVIDAECDEASGNYCSNGYCVSNLVESCTNDTDCGVISSRGVVSYFDHFKCDEGKCVEVTRCGLHGECAVGTHCDGESRVCVNDGTNDWNSTPVVGGEQVVRQFKPRAAMTQREADLNRTIYQYSSIMDYGQRFNSDILGIGKYDRATIKYGYGRLMEVYTDVSKLHAAAHKQTQMYGDPDDTSNAYNLDSTYWNAGIYFSQFYFLNNQIGPEASKSSGDYWMNRASVPYDLVRDEHVLAMNAYRQEHDWSYIKVPYNYMADEWRGNVGCYTWDTGVDILEIIHSMNIQLNDYYLMDAFKRGRYGFGLGGNPLGYMSRIQERYMDPMRGAAMYYALYGHLLKNYGWRSLWANAPLMGWALRRASEYGFEILANSMASPAPGSFKLNLDTNVYENISFEQEAPGSELNIALGDGKYPYTTFWDGAGYYYFDHAQYFGSFWEKMAALMTLTDSTVYFTSNYVGEQLDIGVGTSLGFNTMYPQLLVELLGGISVDETDYYGYEGSGAGAAPHQYFDVANSNAYILVEGDPGSHSDDYYASTVPGPYFTPLPVSDARRIQPSINNLTLKMHSMLYGMAYLPASFDPSFVDSFLICLDGTPECHDIGPKSGITPRTFRDPFSGKTYKVWGPTYQTDWFSPNETIIDKANTLLTEWETAPDDDKPALEQKLRETIEVLDMMRGIYQIYSALKI
ncbi:MAG TPA: zinc-dependent metalloprotease [Myxococcota bacterium]|nr:zinc-dependent metalloprotease [Myxococcota bacterium]HQP95276.1 zinc-dependent metalloprotease [Myxococcota bacterium]